MPRVLSSWTRVLLDALNDRGINGLELARNSGLPVRSFENPNATFSIKETTLFWEAAVAATGDEALGLWVSRYVKPTSFHALGLATLASRSLREAFERVERYSDIVSNAESVRVKVTAAELHCIIQSRSASYRASPTSVDAIFSQFVRFARFMAKPYEPPVALTLTRPTPSNAEVYSEFFGCPVAFSASQNRLSFRRVYAETLNTNANIFLAEQHDQIAANFLGDLPTSDFNEKLTKIITDQLPSGDMNIKTIAKASGLSVRSLQRWFENSGQHFSGYVANIRRELAEYYLAQTDIPVTEITFLLGFGSTSTLSHAFKKWTDHSPRAYRKLHQIN